MENAPLQSKIAAPTQQEGANSQEGQSMAPPAFQLMASNVVQRQEAAPEGSAPKTLTDTLKELWAKPDKAEFWKFVHDNRAKLKADAEANKWIDDNLGFIQNWRADTVQSDGDHKKWTQAHVKDLTTKVRAKFPSIASIRTFLDSTLVTNDFKLQILGQIMAQIGQAEYILGTMFHQGGTWETGGSNNGPIVNEYHKATGFTWAQDEWCTMFAGYLHLLVGFRENLVKKEGVMWSNPRIRSWHEDNKQYTNAKKDIETPSDYKNYSGASINRSAWQTLKASLVAHYAAKFKDEDEKKAALSKVMTDFFKDHIAPQAGDTVVLNNSKTAANPENHTIVVEAYDAANWTISTVEGNSDNKVRGRLIKLSSPPRAPPPTQPACHSCSVPASSSTKRPPTRTAKRAKMLAHSNSKRARATWTRPSPCSVRCRAKHSSIPSPLW
ncbi:MAG: hypothetical protein U0176_11900 [Bacteroidia bacterium]